MKKLLCFMTLCLLMTAPYIIGGETAVRESEMPNAHSMVRKTIKRTYYLTDKAKKNNSQRKERLILEGDLQHMPQPTMDFETKRFISLLPVAINSFQSARSQLAYFVRRTIVASGLSKTQARKHVKLMFPSNSAVRREARRTQLEWYETITDPKSGKPILDKEGNEQEKLVRETMKEGVARVTLNYTARQIILHQELSSLLHSQWSPTFDGLENDHTVKATELGERITSLGGYTSIYDVEMAAKEEIYEIEKFHSAIDHKNYDALVKYEKWSEEGNPLLTEACFKALPELEGKFELGTERSLIYEKIEKGFNARCNENREEKEAKVTAVKEMLAQKQSQHNELEVTKLYNEMKEHESLADRFGFYSDSCSSNFNSEEFDAPWMDQQLSMSLVRENFILTQLKNVELDGNVDFALLHHPGLLYGGLTPSSVSEMLGAQLLPDANSGFRIPRKEKPVFKGNLDKEGINNIRQLSEKLGLPTRIDNHAGFKDITTESLWEQYHNSSFELKVPTGVLAELGREFNGFFNEGERYNSKWAGETYQFTTPTIEVQQKQEEQQEFDELFDLYNFG